MTASMEEVWTGNPPHIPITIAMKWLLPTLIAPLKIKIFSLGKAMPQVYKQVRVLSATLTKTFHLVLFSFSLIMKRIFKMHHTKGSKLLHTFLSGNTHIFCRKNIHMHETIGKVQILKLSLCSNKQNLQNFFFKPKTIYNQV